MNDIIINEHERKIILNVIEGVYDEHGYVSKDELDIYIKLGGKCKLYCEN